MESTLALLWSHRTDLNQYEVRSAGQTIRLYTNGVFHSQFNPVRPLGGGLWDLLSLPALFLPAKPALRVLVLGVGGGAVMRQLRVLLESPDIIGVDLDAVHLKIARRWFGVTARGDRLIHADARHWLAHYSGQGFDLIIDDLFAEHDGEPLRAVPVNENWSAELQKILNPQGVIVVNYLDRTEQRSSALNSQSANRFYRFEHPMYQNSIGVYLSTPLSLFHWQQRVDQHQRLSASQKRVALVVRVSRVG